MWLVQTGTNITIEELAFIRQAGFKLKPVHEASPQTPVVGVSRMDKSTPKSDKQTSNARSKKWRHVILKEAKKRIASAKIMIVTMIREEIITSDYHVVFHITTSRSYEVQIKAKPSCTCPDFQKRDGT